MTMRTTKLLADARRRNARRDRVDHFFGHAAPPDLPLSEYVRNAASAFRCALEMPRTDEASLAEGLAMLEDIWRRLRAQEERDDPGSRGVPSTAKEVPPWN
jgi:hypothetical protein